MGAQPLVADRPHHAAPPGSAQKITSLTRWDRSMSAAASSASILSKTSWVCASSPCAMEPSGRTATWPERISRWASAFTSTPCEKREPGVERVGGLRNVGTGGS